MSGRVLFDPKYDLAMFEGPGGFTQIAMLRDRAEGIARAFGIEFVMCKPGTTIPAQAAALEGTER